MKLLRFETTAQWATAVVELWCKRLTINPRLRMCLPAGRTPTPIYAGMIDAVASARVSFRHAQVFLLDEYGGLAPDDPGRCLNMLRHDLLDHIDLPPAQCHAPDTDAAEIRRVCARYDELLSAGLDLALVGIGLNGHVGMNEPGSPVTSRTRRVELHPSTRAASAAYLQHAHLPTWGISVGLAPLLGASELWLLASGARKAQILRRAIADPVTEDVPAALLRTHPNYVVWADQAAAALL